ncbi:MAG TPA: hypothetical protein VKD71_02325 [Gemmataceae bacterium]|nr:hypothetical protein [Gemmataceae bacterium]
MSILLSCRCGKALRVRDELSGKRITCPECGQTLLVEAGVQRGDAIKSAKDERERPQIPQRGTDSDDDHEPRPLARNIAKPKGNAALWIPLAITSALCIGVVVLLIILNSGPDGKDFGQDNGAQAAPQEPPPELQIDDNAEGLISLSDRGLAISGTAVQIGLVEKKELERLLGPMDRVIDRKFGKADLIGIWDKRGIRCYISQFNQRVFNFDLVFDPKASEVPQWTPENPFDLAFKLDGVEMTKATTKKHLTGRTSRPIKDFTGKLPGAYIYYAKHHVSLYFTNDRAGLSYARISVNPDIFRGKR